MVVLKYNPPAIFAQEPTAREGTTLDRRAGLGMQKVLASIKPHELPHDWTSDTKGAFHNVLAEELFEGEPL